MPLSPEDVRSKQFTTVRLREGYDEDEVDAFLDEVEAELTRLLRDNEDLRARLQAAARTPGEPAVAAQVPPSESAVAILEMARRTADDAVAQARAEADKLLAEARVNADHMTADARVKADQLTSEAADTHRRTLAELERSKASLQSQVDDLKAFEKEYRSRLRQALESLLREVDGRGQASGAAQAAGAAPAAPAAAPAHGGPAASGAPPAAAPAQPAAPPAQPAAPPAQPAAPPASHPFGGEEQRPVFAPPSSPPVQPTP